MDELKIILDRMKKPLAFASRDNFAHLKSLAALEPFMQVQAEELKRVAKERPEVSEIEELFSGFDSLTPEKKKDRILKASAVIDALEYALIPSADHSELTSSPGNPPHPSPLPQGERVQDVSRPSIGGEQGESDRGFLHLDTPIQYCKGVGPKRAELFGKLGISTVEDALTYLPWRYEDRGNLKKIGRLAYGSYETVSGEVVSAEVVQTKRQRVKIFELLITDRSGMLVGSWFNQPFMKKMFKPGQKVILSGIVKANPYKGGLPQIDNPDYEIMEDNEADNLIHTGRTVPIYRTTAGLSVRYLRSMIKTVLDTFGAAAQDMLPGPIVKKYSLMPLPEAFFEAHFPTKEKDLAILNRGTSAAHRRLSFEELFVLELGLALRKRGLSTEKKGIRFKPMNRLDSELRKNLPYQLTAAQERVIAEIKRDMTRERPMNRLVQGDVGSGKTVVALFAALLAVENGYQVCVMAPTEILAEQHYKNMGSMAQPLGVAVRSLTGGRKKKDKEAVVAEIASGDASARGRHPCAHRRTGEIQTARPRRDRRTASLRRHAALHPYLQRL